LIVINIVQTRIPQGT